jgi:hypothetical protein
MFIFEVKIYKGKECIFWNKISKTLFYSVTYILKLFKCEMLCCHNSVGQTDQMGKDNI